MLSVLSLSALTVSSVKSNALNRASARDFYADYYDDADYYYDDAYDAEYDAYLMYEEAAENLERAEREFELMQQLLGEDKDKGTDKTAPAPARDEYFDEYYYMGGAPGSAPAPPAPVVKTGPDGKPLYAARNGYSNHFGDPSTPVKTGPDGKPLYAARNGYSNHFGDPSTPVKTGPDGKPLYAARNGYANRFGEPPKDPKKTGSGPQTGSGPLYTGTTGSGKKDGEYSSRMLRGRSKHHL